MNMLETNPTLYQLADNHVDYSEMYRIQETLQLNKRLRKTRNILLIAAFVFIVAGSVFLVMPETSFTIKNFLAYIGVAGLMVLLAFYSNKQPFFSIVVFLNERSIFALYDFPLNEFEVILSNIPLPSSPIILPAIFCEI